MKVLMATDGSKDATTAITSAARLLRKKDLHVDVLCVAPQLTLQRGPQSTGRGRLHDTYKNKITKESELIVQRAQNVLQHEGLSAKALADLGSPADEIIQRALDYDMVVVGAYGKYERRQPGLGPTSNLVVQNAQRTVLVGRELSNETNYRVLVALDASDASFGALDTLGTNFDVASLDVTLMHVVEMPWARLRMQEPGEGGAVEEPTELEDYQRELERELRLDSEAVIDRGVRQLEKWNVSATTIIEEGDPALELTSHAEAGNYDLVVTGATGSSDVKHALLGSVSLKLAWNLPCSVIVVRT
jgi:nucleotide-binding universal stress UspA family protein